MEALPRPDWLRPLGTREDAIFEHSIPVSPAWWRDALAKTPFAGEEPPSEEHLTRGNLFDLAEDAKRSALGARRLLWASLSWGTGRRHRLNRKRIESVVRASDGGDVLRQAAVLSRTDPRAAYQVLRPTKSNALACLGPPFFTKFLYFAGGGDPEHPCLILDSFVADTLQKECGWTSLTRTDVVAFCHVPQILRTPCRLGS